MGKEEINEVDEFLEYVGEMSPKALYPTEFKKAIIGIAEIYGKEPVILLDRSKIIDMMMEDGMEYEEAVEYFDFNIIGSYMGEGTPCFATLVDDILY